MGTTRAAIYTRISDDREGEEAGVTRQREDCRALVAKHPEWQLVEPIFEDNDVSATSGKVRPAFEDLIEQVEAGSVRVVVAWTSNRFLRSRRDRMRVIELFKERGVRLVAVKGQSYDYTTADGRMMADVIGSFDAGEAERTAERVQRAAQQRAENGEYHGGQRAYGWGVPIPGVVREDGRPKVDPYAVVPDEEKVLKEAANRVVGGEPLSSIVADFDRRRIPGPGKSGYWDRTGLRRMLVNPRIAGLRTYQNPRGSQPGGHNVLGPAKWPGILTVPEWEAVCAVLTDARRRTTTGNTVRHLLAGFCHCGTCGRKMVGRASADVYTCPPPSQGGQCPKRMTVRKSALERLVVDLVARRLADLELTPPVPATQTANEIAALELRARQVSDGFAKGDVTMDAATMMITSLNKQMETLRGRLAAEDRQRAAAVPVDGASRWTSGDLTRRRAVLSALLDGIVVTPGNGNTFNPDRVHVVWRSYR